MDDHDSSDRSLPVILKSRSRQKTVVIDSSHVSLASTDTTGGLRQSIDKSMDRLRSYGSLDGGDRKPSMDVGKRISNFMHRKKKGKSKKARDNDDGLGIEMDRGRSHAPVTAGEGLLYPESANRNSIDGDAQSWTRSHSGSRDSSLLTDDSDEEEYVVPSFISHLASPFIGACHMSSPSPFTPRSLAPPALQTAHQDPWLLGSRHLESEQLNRRPNITYSTFIPC